MAFADNLRQLPSITHLAAIELLDDSGGVVARIPNQSGKTGSVAVYAALAEKYGRIHAEAAQEGLALYAEHVEDARQNPGKHPNVERLQEVIASGREFGVRVVEA